MHHVKHEERIYCKNRYRVAYLRHVQRTTRILYVHCTTRIKYDAIRISRKMNIACRKTSARYRRNSRFDCKCLLRGWLVPGTCLDRTWIGYRVTPSSINLAIIQVSDAINLYSVKPI